MRRLSSTNESRDAKRGISKFLVHFSNRWNLEAIYIVDNIGDRADPWPTPMLAKKKRNIKLFQLYVVHLLER